MCIHKIHENMKFVYIVICLYHYKYGIYHTYHILIYIITLLHNVYFILQYLIIDIDNIYNIRLYVYNSLSVISSSDGISSKSSGMKL